MLNLYLAKKPSPKSGLKRAELSKININERCPILLIVR